MKFCGETLLFLNAVIDTGLLVCSARLCGEQLRWGRMILAGVLGGAYAVAAVLPGGDFLRHGFVKASMAAAICLVAFGASARYFRLTAVYCAMGCLFAGLVLAFTQLTGTGLLQLSGGGFIRSVRWHFCPSGRSAWLSCGCCLRGAFNIPRAHMRRWSCGWEKTWFRFARSLTPETHSRTP